MARLNIAERRVPQDGRISLRLAGRTVDVRVSTLPTYYGERVVMRILEKEHGPLALEQIGMPADVRKSFIDLIHAPHGIFLVTGPTGSGKTTTLYAALQQVRSPGVNIITIEDPVEYDLEGVGQIPVNTRTGMTFARGLRAILRQDPDVIMVGEVRDLETAEVSVQASLTGHLVFSTLHTNDAVGSITRLMDMGIEPYLVASSLLGVMAQRLVRKLCLQCRRPGEADEGERQLLDITKGGPLILYYPQGCEYCGHTGYRNRTGIYELMVVNDDIRHLIHDSQGEQALRKTARQYGMRSLREDGVAKVIAGETSLEEVLRVAQS
jgi:general secretion pathway protein E